MIGLTSFRDFTKKIHLKMTLKKYHPREFIIYNKQQQWHSICSAANKVKSSIRNIVGRPCVPATNLPRVRISMLCHHGANCVSVKTLKQIVPRVEWQQWPRKLAIPLDLWTHFTLLSYYTFVCMSVCVCVWDCDFAYECVSMYLLYLYTLSLYVYEYIP